MPNCTKCSVHIPNDNAGIWSTPSGSLVGKDRKIYCRYCYTKHILKVDYPDKTLVADLVRSFKNLTPKERERVQKAVSSGKLMFGTTATTNWAVVNGQASIEVVVAGTKTKPNETREDLVGKEVDVIAKLMHVDDMPSTNDYALPLQLATKEQVLKALITPKRKRSTKKKPSVADPF